LLFTASRLALGTTQVLQVPPHGMRILQSGEPSWCENEFPQAARILDLIPKFTDVKNLVGSSGGFGT
jgi:hypothetical protein